MSYSCSLCGRQYSRRWSLNRHYKACKVTPDNETFHTYCKPESEKDSLSGEEELRSQRLESVDSHQRLSSEDQEDNSRHSEDENSEMDYSYPLAGPYNDDCVMETSESEDEFEDDINMDEDKKRWTLIKWPISRTYKIINPWTFWGEEPRIKKHIRWIERLMDVEQPTVVYNIQNASDSQVASLCEIAYNCVRSQVPLERWNWKELARHRRVVRFLARSDVNLDDKRDEILRRGAKFVETLLCAVQPLIEFNIPRSMKVKSLKEESDEEEVNDDAQ